MYTVSQEVREIFEEPDFAKILKTLAEEFGENTTLKTIYNSYEQNRPAPEKLINGKRYIAGYRGAKMVSEGTHSGKLLEIKQNGSNCKLMFSIDGLNVFLYHTFPREQLKIEQIVKLGSIIGEVFAINVKHDVIPTTGDKHAVIDKVTGLKDVLNGN